MRQSNEAIRFGDREWLVGAVHCLTEMQVECVTDNEMSAVNQIAISGMVAEAGIRFSSSAIKGEVLLSKLNRGQGLTASDLKDFRNRLISILSGELNSTCLSAHKWESRNLKHTEARAFFNKMSASCEEAGLTAELLNVGCSSVVRISASSGQLNPNHLVAAVVKAKGGYNVGV